MTNIEPSQLFGLISLVGASLLAVAFAVGLVLSLLRWNEGAAPRLATLGFGLHLIALATNQFGFHIVGIFYSGGDEVLYVLMVISSLATLLSLVAWGLLIAALRWAFLDATRWRSGFSAER